MDYYCVSQKSSVEDDDLSVVKMDSHWSAITKASNNQIVASSQEKLRGICKIFLATEIRNL